MAVSKNSTRRLRVLWLAKGLGPGGMERLLVNHARVGDRSGFDYLAAYLVDRPHSVVPELEALDVRCFRFTASADLDVRWGRQLRSLVRRERIDVVHTHSPMVAAIARPALRSMRNRPGLVYTEHNSWDCYSAPTRLANALTYPLDDVQIAVSTAAAASPPKLIGDRVETLVHGIDVAATARVSGERSAARAELGVGDDTILVVTLANLRAEKAYDVLLDAAARCVSATDRVAFVSVGQGPLEAEMRQRHEALGLGESFRFLGFRDDPHRMLAAADIFALSSRHEGLPVALMEASALGLPIVATRVGGLPDVIDSGATGVLVAPEDPAALAAAILDVARDAELRERLSGASLALAERFDARNAVNRLESIYRQVAR